MAKTKSKRLFKISRELNVSVDTLVEHLQQGEYADALSGKGINASVTEDAYEALVNAFAADRAVAARVKEKRAAREAEVRDGDTPVRRLDEEEEDVVDAAPAPAPQVEVPVEAPAEPEPEPPTAVEEVPEIVEPVSQPEPAVAAEAEVVEPETQPEPETEPEVAEPVGEVETPALEKEQEEVVAAAKEAETEPTTPAEAEAAEVAEPDDDGDVEAVGEVAEEALISAKRYQLAGTKVLGKLDLATVDDEKPKKRKRKRKRKTAAEAATEGAVKVDDKTAKERAATVAKKKKKRRRGPAVDEEDVEQTLQETLRELEMGVSRARQRRRRERRERHAAGRERTKEHEAEQEHVLRVTEFVSTGELANLMDVPVSEVISTLFKSGMIVSINQRLDADTISFVADEYEFDVEFITDFGTDDIKLEADLPEDLRPRPPIVTVMGHVDHGKTSLLDRIRKTNVVAGEAGGITQHIGAYSVEMPDSREITFLDTPGHEAFTAMRARGAKVTDVVILVVAADDAVMPQTVEAINHARAAEVPLIVAINKIDRPQANTQRVMQQLADQNVLVEQYGGKVQCVMVSAMTGEGLDDLLEKVLLEAELLEVTANPDRNATGIVIESRLEKGRGNVATVLVQNGTLKIGDNFVGGIHSGRVRAMFDEREKRITEVGPGRPAMVLGFTGAPEVGDQFVVMDDEKDTREIAQRRSQIHREQSLRQRKHITLDEIGRRLALGEFRELNLIIKGDVGGSVEALSDSLLKLGSEEVAVQIIHSGVGAITESDVMLASASDAVILGFQVRPSPSARQIAEREEIDVRLYSVIYDAISDVHDALEGLLSPAKKEQTVGTAEVRNTFKVPKAGTIAGCYVVEGKIRRNDQIRVIRDGIVIFTGNIASLKRFKDDVRDVQSGYECGIAVSSFNDIREGDHLEGFEIVEEKRKLKVTS